MKRSIITDTTTFNTTIYHILPPPIHTNKTQFNNVRNIILFKHFKINILNVKDAGSVAGSDYGTFSLQVRSVNFNNDSSRLANDSVMEQFDNLTFDPSETNYFARVIGDRFVEIDSNGKLTFYGDYPNKSKHIRVGDFSNLETFPTTAVPFGFNKLKTEEND